MSSRFGYTLAVIVLLIAAALRFWSLTELPPGLNNAEITDLRIMQTVLSGRIEVFYSIGGEGREGLYHVIAAGGTLFFGDAPFSFRVISVFAGLITLALVYALTTRLFGPLAGVAAAALLTTSFWPVLLSRSIARETFVPLLVAAVLFALARALRVYGRRGVEPNTTPFAALGALLGLGFYLHPHNFMLALLSMVFIAYMVITRQSSMTRRTLSYTNFAILVLIIIAMPYVISSIRLPQLGGAGRVIGDYEGGIIRSTAAGLTSLLINGDLNPLHNLPGRPMFDLVSVLFLLLGVITALRYWKQPRFALALFALAMLLPPAVLTAGTPDFQKFSVLLPVLAVFFGLGVNTLYNSLPRQSRPFAALGLLALFGFNLVWMGSDLFVQWQAREDVQTAYHARQNAIALYLDRTAASIPTMMCSPNLPSNRLSSADLILLMTTRDDQIVRTDCGSGLVLLNGGEGQQVILPDANSLQTAHPYIRGWLEMGEMISADELPENAVIQLRVADALADRIGLFTSTAPVRFPPEAGGSSDPLFPPIPFGGNITFLGYEPLEASTIVPGGFVTSITYWRVDGVVPPDVQFFTHLLSDPALIVAQTDTISVEIPAQLQPRDILVQVTFIPLPRTLPNGSYTLSIGAYQDADGARMPVLDSGQPRGNRLFINTLIVTSN